MNWLDPRRSLRLKLVLAAVAVEVLLLALLLGNGLRLSERALLEQSSLRLAELNALFSAALVGPLAERDYAALGEILAESRQREGLLYLLLHDRDGRAVAAAGHPLEAPPPAADASLAASVGAQDHCYDTQTPLLIAGQS